MSFVVFLIRDTAELVVCGPVKALFLKNVCNFASFLVYSETGAAVATPGAKKATICLNNKGLKSALTFHSKNQYKRSYSTMSNSFRVLLKSIGYGNRPGKGNSRNSFKTCRFRLEQLEPRMLLSAQAYDWNSVTIKANGFIDGIVYNPAAPNTVYIHTDMGGAYRWDQAAARWMPMNDWSQWNDWSPQNLGVETLAVDPTNANRVYMAVGTYMSPTAIMRSTDGGRTWLRTDVSGINSNGNGSARNAGERMNVDPNSPNILFYGTRDDGLWKSTDYGVSWAQVATFPTIGQDSGFTADTGIVWTLFDKSSSTPGVPTQTIYAGVVQADAGLNRIYRSTDGGATWSAIPGQPTTANYFPQRAQLTPDGNTLYITYGYSTSYPGPYGIAEGMVQKVTNPNAANPAWTDISPPVTYGFSGVALDPTNPNIVYVTELNDYNPADRVWRSTDAGGSWTVITPNSNRNDSSAPYASSLNVHWMGDFEIDPLNRDVAMFTTGYGLYRTTNLTAATPAWTFFNEGFEQSAVLELSSPNTGDVHLMSAIGDRDGYRHDDFTQSPSLGRLGQNTGMAEGTCDDIDTAFNDANYQVRLTRVSPYVQYSNNNGVTWNWVSSTGVSGSTSGGGNLAISADGTKIVYEPGGTGRVIYSTRSGSTWSSWSAPATNRPANGAKIVADLVAPQTFYAYVGSTVSRSTDGGANWTIMTTTAPSGGNWIRALPGQAGHLVMSLGNNGLWRSTNGGANWSQLGSGVVTTANQVGVGIGPTPGSYPSIYVGGSVSGQTGFFRSDDQGATWMMISDLSHQYGWVTVIQGDPRIYGRLYVGTNGRGILYADIHSAQTYLPGGWSTQDVGLPGSAGSAGSPASGTWEVVGGGSGIGGTVDSFRFAYTSLTGDGSITARVISVPNDSPSNHNAKAGVMIRDGIDPVAANVLLAMSPGSVNGAFFQYRATRGGVTAISTTPGIWNPYWVRLTRSGNTFSAYLSANGENWTLVGTAVVAMGATVSMGLAVTASDNNQLDISTFQNVSVSTPTHIWDGGSLVDDLWTTPENWVGDVAPDPGDNLIFPAGAARLDNVNDFSQAVSFGTITVSGSGYHFQTGGSGSSSVEVQEGAQLEVDKIVTGALTVGAGGTVTISPLPGGPIAADSPLTPLAANTLQPTQIDTITAPAGAGAIASSPTAAKAFAAASIFPNTDLAPPAPADSEAIFAAASPDSASNTVPKTVAAPAGISADAPLSVPIVESAAAIRIDSGGGRRQREASAYSSLAAWTLHEIVQADLQRPLAAITGPITGAPLLRSTREELRLRESNSQQRLALSAPKSRQAVPAALQSVLEDYNWSDADAEGGFDIAKYSPAGKHSRQLKKAIDDVLSREDAFVALL
jgi:hypothetical protein